MRPATPGKVLYLLAIMIAAWNSASSSAQSGSVSHRSDPALPATGMRTNSTIAASLTPVRAGVTIGQSLELTAAAINDPSNSGVTWTSSGGALRQVKPGFATFTAQTAGTYTITATSRADRARSASTTVGVTGLGGVTTWRNDREHSGINSQEYALTPEDVTAAKFGKLFSCAVDGWVFAQPLWVANLHLGTARHNAIFVATENDSVYAFDADQPDCRPIWSSARVNLIPSDEKIAPLDDLHYDSISLGPFTGITGTPVIDQFSHTLYLVAVTENRFTGAIIQRLHALDIATGRERPRSPVVIAASVRGTAYHNPTGTVMFEARMQKQRAALLLLNGVVYVCWGSYFDKDPYHGWVIGYNASTLKQVSVFNDTPDGARGGIWMSAAADAAGNLYVLSGNGDFNANSPGGRNYSDSLLKLRTSSGLVVSDWFTPFDQKDLAAQDLDFGGGGAVLVPDQPKGRFPHLVLASAKSGTLYVLDRDHLGHFNQTSNSQIVQTLMVDSNGIYSTPLFWHDTVYVGANVGPLRAFHFSSETGKFEPAPTSQSKENFDYPGTTPVLSAAGEKNAILWAIDPARPGILHAYDPSNLSHELWNSSQAANKRDQPGRGIKFTVPTVANGKVYLGTRTELDVYGLLPK
ncbi:pyrrolo-quinoline quinone [Acidobacteria bacterium AB60]|nr:pyrrolo-quinoline quinone [Acidobacteria bacterium AB60]